MSTEAYWLSKTFVVDWSLRKVDGTPATGATVAGAFSRPDGTPAVGTVVDVGLGDDGGELYRITFDVDAAGWWAYRLTATGTADGAEEGTFYVRPSLFGGPVNTYDPSTDAGRVRLLIRDTQVHDPDRCVFDDPEITAFLTMNRGYKRAAAAACDVISVDELQISKIIQTQDLKTNAAEFAKAMRAQAQALRDQANDDDDDDPDSGGLMIVDFDSRAGYRARWG